MSHYEMLRQVRSEKREKMKNQLTRQEGLEGWVILSDDIEDDVGRGIGYGKDGWAVQSATESYVYQLPPAPY